MVVSPDVARSAAVRTDGIALRDASDDERELVRTLVGRRFGEVARSLFDAMVGLAAPHPPRVLVAVDGERVVATLCLRREHLRLAGVSLPVGHLDFAATALQYEGRGLMGDLVALAHAISAAQGDVAQVLVGIPVYYRRFGYRTSIQSPPVHRILPDDELDPPPGWQVRPAEPDDVTAVMTLQDRTQEQFDVVMARDRGLWSALISAGTPETVVAVRDGMVGGYARRQRFDGGAFVSEVAAHTVSAVHALLADTRGGAPPVTTVRVAHRPGTLLDLALATVGVPGERPDPLQVRIADPAALLRSLRPVLSDRLTASGYADYTGRLILSLFGTAIAMACGDGTVVDVSTVPARSARDATDSAELDPDLFPALVFGSAGAMGMERQSDAVKLWEQRGLLGALFPPLRADLLVYFV